MLDLVCVIIFVNYLLLKYSVDTAKLYLILKFFIPCTLDHFFFYYTNECLTSNAYK